MKVVLLFTSPKKHHFSHKQYISHTTTDLTPPSFFRSKHGNWELQKAARATVPSLWLRSWHWPWSDSDQFLLASSFFEVPRLNVFSDGFFGSVKDASGFLGVYINMIKKVPGTSLCWCIHSLKLTCVPWLLFEWPFGKDGRLFFRKGELFIDNSFLGRCFQNSTRWQHIEIGHPIGETQFDWNLSALPKHPKTTRYKKAKLLRNHLDSNSGFVHAKIWPKFHGVCYLEMRTNSIINKSQGGEGLCFFRQTWGRALYLRRNVNPPNSINKPQNSDKKNIIYIYTVHINLYIFYIYVYTILQHNLRIYSSERIIKNHIFTTLSGLSYLRGGISSIRFQDPAPRNMACSSWSTCPHWPLFSQHPTAPWKMTLLVCTCENIQSFSCFQRQLLVVGFRVFNLGWNHLRKVCSPPRTVWIWIDLTKILRISEAQCCTTAICDEWRGWGVWAPFLKAI